MKTLGLDIGTNSIGWGIVDENAEKIEKCGVYIFPEGVKIEKGVESSKASERTGFRSARRLKFRRKLRKYETLKVLINNGMCPLTLEELEKWHKGKIYPTSKDFINWYRTDEEKNWEPYFLRKKCVEQKCEPYEIGRALYHIAQRRGFLSNRKETTKETDGKVSEGISELSKAKGNKTLGQYFYELKQAGEKVRGKYTSRKEHYEEEFNRICEIQGISEKLKGDLYKAIFFQRKLKSQKFLVGKCTFETDKSRCPISHFEFEEFRMLSFINSIRVYRNSEDFDGPSLFDDLEEHYPKDNKLTEEEKESIKTLFFRSKGNFDFKDIAKKIRGKNDEWGFNYRDDTNVAGCPVSRDLKNIFGEDWKNIKIPNEDSASDKKYYDINDIWHVLYDFDDDEKLHEFALNKLHLDSETAEKFCAIHFQQGYANLSLKAIRKILPFLKKGYVYSHAVFLANIPTMIGEEVYNKHTEEIEKAVETINSTLKDKNNRITLANRCIEAIFKDEKHDFHSEEWDKSIVDVQIADLFGKRKFAEKPLTEQKEIRDEVIAKIEETLKIAVTKNPNDYKYKPLRTDELILEYLNQQGFKIKKNAKLYHPSETEYNLERPKESDDGKTYLGSPRTPSVKNPVAMRALFQLRKLVNYLIKTGEIDSETWIHVELANEVNDKNWRKAIEDFQRENEKKNAEYKARIIELCKESGFEIEPTDSDVKKYRLWKEQNETCPYTGNKIRICDLFGPHPNFDFEHTIPRSLSYDDSLENLTLCDSKFNRKEKKQRIPSELPNFEEISRRFERMYESKIDECLSAIERNKTRAGYIDPEVKNRKIVARHKAQLELDYYKGKLRRVNAKEVTGGFKHSQLNDTRIITNFALQYLKSVFPHTFPVKGSMTDTFKKQWNLGMYAGDNKDRSNYRHHAVDALTIACVDRRKFNLLSEAIRNSSDGTHLKFAKPWDSFDKDVLSAVQYIVPKHYVDDNSLRQTKKVLRDMRTRKPKLDRNGNKIYIQGNTARGSLHKDTFYGCIMTPPEKDENLENKKPIFVQRVEVRTLVEENNKLMKDIYKVIEKNADKIVDKGIRNTFCNNLESGKQTLVDIHEKGILLPYQMNGKDVYVKRVRIKAKDVKQPIPIKKHKEQTVDYKQNYYVKNEENYLIALYRGKDAKEKSQSDYIVLNLLDAVHKKHNGERLYPAVFEKKGASLALYKVLKIGKIVILKQTEDEDVFALPKEKFWERIYSVIGINADGRIKLTNTSVSTAWVFKANCPISEYSDFRLSSVNQVSVLVEGTDFTISPIGEIIPKK
ncbi:type II CRISPR RNA-guided endonuclease Cas9 [Treponema sp.]|uniref:type II CRISPR RNA-guided endonuclease Cas9 n=1 Tax=Treponema sp. TaxID=166 RepID=UPI0025FD8C57|nr:type II CRISPR RNA-guided endonuclease Cas9 [Treponema sp.]MBR4321867.1 type II CRISPR RNA-guided endonuclease Cas9 [Treponema sp.]